MIVLYYNPWDCPGMYVAREFAIDERGITPASVAIVAKSYGELLTRLPAGMMSIPRHPNDEPQILEVWI